MRSSSWRENPACPERRRCAAAPRWGGLRIWRGLMWEVHERGRKHKHNEREKIATISTVGLPERARSHTKNPNQTKTNKHRNLSTGWEETCCEGSHGQSPRHEAAGRCCNTTPQCVKRAKKRSPRQGEKQDEQTEAQKTQERKEEWGGGEPCEHALLIRVQAYQWRYSGGSPRRLVRLWR